MRRALFLLLFASCLLDPVGVLNRAALYVRAFELPVGGSLHLTTVDSKATIREKRTRISAATMEILYEEGALSLGPVSVSAEAFDEAGGLVGCGTARGVVGEDEVVVIGFASPSSSAVNCGSCGNRCETDVSTGVCVMGRCTGWECAPGLVPESDGGCSMPLPPDAGPMDMDAGMDDAGMGDAGTDAGTRDAGPTVCVPMAEDSEVTCGDGADNNCDLRTDCADPGCTVLTRSCAVTNGSCTGAGVQPWDCASKTWGTCVSDQSAEHTRVTCKDGIDNDCDGKKDCNDEECQNIKESCGVDICAAGLKLWNCSLDLLGLCLPYIPLPENSGLLCNNNLDDDCDGKTDCKDLSCRGRACGAGRICCADGGCATACP